MREFLTFIGIVLCLALAALMAGPHFVDWNQYRPHLQQHMARALGAPVAIEGPVDVTLLPTPSLSIEQVRIGVPGRPGERLFEAERIAMAVSATSLLRGDVHVTEATVDAPVLRLQPGFAPALSEGAGGPISAERFSIEMLRLRDGRVLIARNGQPDIAISAISAEIEANSLLGPAKGSGSFSVGEGRRQFRFALGKLEEGRSRLKALVEDVQLALRLEADGSLGRGEGGFAFDGAVHLSGNPQIGDNGKGVQLPLRATAKSRLDATRAAFEDLTLILGPEPQPLTLTGQAAMAFDGAHRLEATLSARSFDFDRPGPDGKPRAAVPLELIDQAAALVPAGSGTDVPDLQLDLTVGGIIIGGQTIIGGRLGLQRDRRGLGVTALEGELPGQTRIRLTRTPAHPAGLLAGRLETESRDPERFMRWFTGATGSVVSGLSLKASSELEPLADGVRLRDIVIERGETRLSGQGSFLLPVPGRRPSPQVALKLASARLNIADIPSLTVGDRPGERQDLDFDLDIEAAKLMFEGSETGRLVARLRRDGPIVSIERLAVSEFGGANLIASGTIGGGARQLTVKLDAAKVDALAALGEKIVPGALMTSLRHRAPQLAPALLVATFANDEADESYDIKAEGHLAGTRVNVAGKLSGRNDLRLDLETKLESPSGALLAAQIGGRAPAATGAGPARIDLSMRGNPRTSLSTVIGGSMPGIEARVAGNIKIFQPFAPFEGDVTIRASDLAPVAAALGATHPAVPRGTTGSLNGRIESNLERITIENLRAEIGGQSLSGEIAFNLAENGKVAGQIRIPYVDFRPVIALAFGEAKPGAPVWAGEAFGKPLAPPLPGDLWIEADRARLDDKTVFSDAKFVLRFDQGSASVEYARFGLDQARIEGEVFLRRSAGAAFLSSKLKAGGIRLEAIGDGSARGLVDGEVQLSGAGETPGRLLAALAGGGAVTVRNAQVPRFDPQALARLLAVPLERLGPLDSANLSRRLEGELDQAHWSVTEAKLPIVVVNGVARTGAAALESRDGRHEAQASLDLAGMGLDLRITTTATATPPDWRGALPQFSTHWRGALAQPRRSVAVESLVNGYLALALVRDLQKAEIFDQDIRERAAHNRRLKADEAMRKRALEIERYEQAERERIAREKAQEEQRQLEARLLEERRAQELRLLEERRLADERRQEELRLKAEREAEEARALALKAAEEQRQLAARIEEDRLRALKAEEEEARRLSRASEEEAARIQRIQRILQAPETTATPAPPAPRRSAAPQPLAAPLAPPLNLNPPVAGRPRAAAPVEVRPLASPQVPDTAR